jgi:hypothetical protein
MDIVVDDSDDWKIPEFPGAWAEESRPVRGPCSTAETVA